jgi:energy-coupling factor transport system permease protein
MKADDPSIKRLNPITKMILLVAMSIFVILLSDPIHMTVLVIIVFAAKVRFRARGIVTKGITGFAFTIFLAQLLFNHSGETLAELSILRVTSGGISDGIAIAGKFLCLIMMSWIFVATTTAHDLSSALISARFPYRYAFLPALAMRFVPVFRFELATVREAQVTRGMKLDKSLRGIVRSARYTTIPMLMTAMSRVNSIAASMTGRGFGMFSTRTLLRPLRMSIWDYMFLLVSTTMIVTAFFVTRCQELRLV